MTNTEKKVRFSKAAVGEYISKREQALQDAYQFDPDNGTAQLWRAVQCAVTREGIECATNRAVAYGRIEALRDLAEEFGL